MDRRSRLPRVAEVGGSTRGTGLAGAGRPRRRSGVGLSRRVMGRRSAARGGTSAGRRHRGTLRRAGGRAQAAGVAIGRCRWVRGCPVLARARLGGRRAGPARRGRVARRRCAGSRRRMRRRAAEQVGAGSCVGRAADERRSAEGGHRLQCEQPGCAGPGGRPSASGWRRDRPVRGGEELGLSSGESRQLSRRSWRARRREQVGQRRVIRTHAVEQFLVTAGGAERRTFDHLTIPAAPWPRSLLSPGPDSRRASVVKPRWAATRTAPAPLPSTAPAVLASSPTTARRSTASA